MIIDNHVHIGWFSDGYHSPREVWDSEMAAGVDGIVVSSTSTCAELYKVVIREMRELVRIGGERIHPILWLTPKMMKCRYAVPYMLHSKVRWQGVKMHWEAHPEWAHNPKLVERAIDVAQEIGCAVLLHTGTDKTCHAGLFKELICHHEDITFVLAHGRPVDEAIDVLAHCPNAYVDTAFMPVDELIRIVDCGWACRVLFGTDSPINQLFFKDIDTTGYIKRNIDLIKSMFPNDDEVILSNSVFFQRRRAESQPHNCDFSGHEK